MKNFKIQLLLFAAIAFAVSSCKKDDPDNTKPTIDSVLEPLENDTLFSGTELHIDGTVSDNEELSQLKIDIHSAGDGHDHGKVSSASFFEVIRIIDLAGRNQIFHEDIDIPQEAAAGKYHVILTAVDASGNQSDFVERDIVIRNSGDLLSPTITVNSPTSAGIYTLGSPIVVSAELADNIGLGDVEVKVYQGSTLVYDEDLELAQPSYSLNLEIPTTGWGAGEYTLEILVKDQVNNLSDADIEFTLN
ncbi:MAG: DUF4625 domain-containing protein [Bacteroidia bacterium]